ncbi:MAG: hypothetical protein FJX72_11145, partial [Armatimonadetes bacterium]|nr:hypothetical protein [Armatimonadota bacterium]
MRERARHWVRRHCAGVYLGSIGALTAVLMVAVVWAAARAGAGPLALSLLAVFAILPASELAVQITNYMGMQLMPG